jgi:hypothetical protein
MIRRTYSCGACNLEWTVTHASGDEPYPACPVCTIKASWVPKPLRIRTNRSRAIDVAQQTAEGMGLTNMKSSTREGEAVAMGPREPTRVENEAVMSQTVDAMRQLANRSAGTVSPQMAEFLGATGGTLADPTAPLQAPTQLIGAPQTTGNVVPLLQSQAYQAAKVATAQAKALTGESPTGMLHKAMKHEPMRDPRVPVSGANIMAKWKP